MEDICSFGDELAGVEANRASKSERRSINGKVPGIVLDESARALQSAPRTKGHISGAINGEIICPHRISPGKRHRAIRCEPRLRCVNREVIGDALQPGAVI